MTPPDVNILTTIGAAVCGGIATYLVNRFGKSTDARGLAEAALVGIGPTIISEQNKRIADLTEKVDELWRRESECRMQLARALARIVTLEEKTSILPVIPEGSAT